VLRGRLLTGLWLLVLSGAALAAVGAIGRATGLVMLTATLGPTAYMLLAHPESEASRLRSAVAGHGLATVCGLLCLSVFGLWSRPSVTEQHHDSWPQIGAQALAVGLTLLLLSLLGMQHPPAAATAVLIASGIARPGLPLYGMLAGLAVLIAGAALLARIPGPAPGPD
jgi:hypothetical protein